jgi:hypothetical protein
VTGAIGEFSEATTREKFWRPPGREGVGCPLDGGTSGNGQRRARVIQTRVPAIGEADLPAGAR